MKRFSSCRALAAATLALLVPPGESSHARQDSAAGAPMAVSTRRLVRHFDFEEAITIADPMPRNFYRYIESRDGFPEFGRMAYAEDHVHAGTWAFRFDLNGGSLSARIPSHILHTMPLTDYELAVHVRTAGLTHGRALMIAWFHDAAGNPIAESRVRTRPVRTAGAWTRLALSMPGKHLEAVGMVIELQVAQGAQLGAGADGPILEDVSGQAWFDDLMIWQVPQTQLSTTAGFDVVRQPKPVEFDILVRDSTDETLSAELKLINFENDVVSAQRFSAPRGRHPRRLSVDDLEPGWYQAALSVFGSDMQAGGRMLSFCVLPNEGRGYRVATDRFMVVIPEGPPESFTHVPNLVASLGMGGVVLPVWHQESAFAHADVSNDAQTTCIESLLNRRVRLIFTLNGVPYDLARKAGLDADQVLDLLGDDPAIWRPALDELLTRYGLEVERWQVGATGWEGLVGDEQLGADLGNLRSVLTQSVPQPRLIVPMGAHETFDMASDSVSPHVVLPNEVSPEAIAEYARPWLREGGGTIVTLETLPAEHWDPRNRVIDLMIRTLHAWRAEIPHVAIDAPWHVTSKGVDIDPIFVTWRLLADQLDGRTYAGQFDLGPNVHCWILRGVSENDTALVAWTDQVTPTPHITVTALLGSGELTVINAQGRSEQIIAVDGSHELTIGNTPMFIEGVSLPLARFREQLAVTPRYVESTQRLHDADVTVRNPWNTGISGVLRLASNDQWRVAPRVIPFDIPAGGTVRLPVRFRFDRGATSGRHEVVATFEINADQNYSFVTQTPIHLGIRDVQLNATWRLARSVRSGQMDLVVTQTVSNESADLLELDLYLMGPGIPRERRSLTALQPGATGTRTFRIENGAALLAGETLRIGAIERTGAGRLNHVLEIPESVSNLANELANVTPE